MPLVKPRAATPGGRGSMSRQRGGRAERRWDQLPSLAEMISQKRSNPAVGVFGHLSIVLQPVAKQHSSGLKAGYVEGMVSTGVGY